MGDRGRPNREVHTDVIDHLRCALISLDLLDERIGAPYGSARDEISDLKDRLADGPGIDEGDDE